MKIGIDARMLGKGFGIARYIEQLLCHLENIDEENNYVIFLSHDNWDQFTPSNPKWKKVMADIPWYSLTEQLLLPGVIRKEKVDLMHFPHWNVPLLYSGNFVVTIHDLIMYHYPRAEASTHGPLAYWIKDRLHRLVVKNATKLAEKIIAASEFTKKDIVNSLGVNPEKIIVTYQAPTHFPTSKLSVEQILHKYGIKEPYLIYVGAAYPHKNLENLIEAWKIFEEKYGTDYQLVLAGKNNFFYQRLKDSDVSKNCKNLQFAGLIADEDLPVLYSHALFYVFPSLYEGFGLPPLEAMQYGLPVASSDKSCLPEILQDAAYYFDAGNPEKIADSLRHLIVDNKLRALLKERGQKLCSHYSWEKLTLATLNVYNSVDK